MRDLETMKSLRIMLLIILFVPASCWAVVGQMTKLGDDQVAMAPLLTDYLDMIQFGAQKGWMQFNGLQIGGPWGLCTEEHRLCGVQIGLVNSVNRGEMCGLQVGIFNIVNNRWSHSDDVTMNGVQLGVMNYVDAAKGNVHGVFCQVGLLNVVECSGATPYLPLLRVWW